MLTGRPLKLNTYTWTHSAWAHTHSVSQTWNEKLKNKSRYAWMNKRELISNERNNNALARLVVTHAMELESNRRNETHYHFCRFAAKNIKRYIRYIRYNFNGHSEYFVVNAIATERIRFISRLCETRTHSKWNEKANQAHDECTHRQKRDKEANVKCMKKREVEGVVIQHFMRNTRAPWNSVVYLLVLIGGRREDWQRKRRNVTENTEICSAFRLMIISYLYFRPMMEDPRTATYTHMHITLSLRVIERIRICCLSGALFVLLFFNLPFVVASC